MARLLPVWTEPDGSQGRLVTPGERAQSKRYWARMARIARAAGCEGHQHAEDGGSQPGVDPHFTTSSILCEVFTGTEIMIVNGEPREFRCYTYEDHGVGTMRSCTRIANFRRPCPACTGPFAGVVEWLHGARS